MLIIAYNPEVEGVIVNIKNIYIDVSNILWTSFNKEGLNPGVRVMFKQHTQESLYIKCDSPEEVEKLEKDFRTVGYELDPDRFNA